MVMELRILEVQGTKASEVLVLAEVSGIETLFAIKTESSISKGDCVEVENVEFATLQLDDVLSKGFTATFSSFLSEDTYEVYASLQLSVKVSGILFKPDKSVLMEVKNGVFMPAVLKTNNNSKSAYAMTGLTSILLCAFNTTAYKLEAIESDQMICTKGNLRLVQKGSSKEFELCASDVENVIPV